MPEYSINISPNSVACFFFLFVLSSRAAFSRWMNFKLFCAQAFMHSRGILIKMEYARSLTSAQNVTLITVRNVPEYITHALTLVLLGTWNEAAAAAATAKVEKSRGKTFRRFCVNFSKRLIQQICENILIFHITSMNRNEVRQPKAVIQVDTLTQQTRYGGKKGTAKKREKRWR